MALVDVMPEEKFYGIKSADIAEIDFGAWFVGHMVFLEMNEKFLLNDGAHGVFYTFTLGSGNALANVCYVRPRHEN